MKKSIIPGLLCLLTGLTSVHAQVSISPNGNPPDSSAMLDVRSTNKGVLLPRMTGYQVLHIVNPATGLLVYCLDLNKLIIYNGNDWTDLQGGLVFDFGSSYQGGAIFYFNDDMEAYVITPDLAVDRQWGCYGTLIGPLNGSGFIGSENTDSIVSGCPEPDIAAEYCHSLSYNGYSDWYLPSRSELNYAIINVPDLAWSGNYWTSTEFSAILATKINTNTYFWAHKNTTATVRCVRFAAEADCSPQPNIATPGSYPPDRPGNSITLNANYPDEGCVGQWTIVSGTGGNIADLSNPKSVFTGLSGNSYTLKWTISNDCGQTQGLADISFQCVPQPTSAYAGPDRNEIIGNSTTLEANVAVSGSGVWDLRSGWGQILSPTDPQSTFIRQYNGPNILRWTITTACASSYDEVEIEFQCQPQPLQANAGPDQIIPYYDVYGNEPPPVTLQANEPLASGTGHWSLLNLLGTFADPDNPNTIFYPAAGYTYDYYLRWVLTSECGQSSDTMSISYYCAETVSEADAGPDQLNLPGATATLAGNPALPGETDYWTCLEGSQYIYNYNDPNTTLNGQPGHAYTLLWLHQKGCAYSRDTMYVSFLCPDPPANAGPDQLNLAGTSTSLQGNAPLTGTGMWSIISGFGGNLLDPVNPSTIFSGIPGNIYNLRWTLPIGCPEYDEDDVYISFSCSTAEAGPDQMNLSGTSLNLAANTPSTGTCLWNIISGTGGTIAAPTNPNSSFNGLAGGSYILRWTVSCASGTNYDDVNISFECSPQPTPSEAGPDQLSITSLSTTLEGNTPVIGTGEWSIITGTGGVIADPLNPTSIFNGTEGNTYTLRWSITTCATSYDEVIINFACPAASGGPDQLNVPGTSTTLQATAPWAGSGLWTVQGGTGGTITDPFNPTSNFTGVPGCTGYTLRWTVNSNCAAVFDDVFINFECTPMPTVANAGPDQLNVAGVTTTLQANTAAVGTSYWIIVSGANGIIANPADPASLFTGTNGTSYVLRWIISNSCCSTMDEVTISYSAFACGNSFQDIRDGKAYTTVQIGSQCWMKQNLNFASGTSACYAGNPANCDNYGRLYDWTTASTACPSGYHLATDAEWCTLLSGIDGTVSCAATGVTGTDAGGKMKETGTTFWAPPNAGANNSSGFSARGGGSTTISGHNLTQWGSFWTASANGSNKWSWEMNYNDPRIWRNYYAISNTLSVRCLKN